MFTEDFCSGFPNLDRELLPLIAACFQQDRQQMRGAFVLMRDALDAASAKLTARIDALQPQPTEKGK